MVIYKVTSVQYKNLLEDGSITVNGKVYDYDSKSLYWVVDYGLPEYEIKPDNSENSVDLYKDGDLVSSASIEQMSVKHSHNADEAAALYYEDDSGKKRWIYGKSLQTSLDSKLNKVSSEGNYRLYMITSKGGQGVVQLLPTPPTGGTPFSVPWYTADGRIKTRTPQDDLDCTNKAYVDSKVSSVYRPKGSVDNYSDLPTENNQVGDVWNIKNADEEHGINAGDNVAWTTDNEWDPLGGTIDLSNYATKTELADKLDRVSTTSGYYRVYAIKPNGEQGVQNYGSSIVAGNIVSWSSNGTLKTNTPINDNDATPKSYVDTSLQTKLDKVTSATQDSVYGVSVTKGIEPFQTDSVLNPTTTYSPTNIGAQVLKYKTIIGLVANGYTSIQKSYEILSNKITVTPNTSGSALIAFRFTCTPGAKFKLNYSGTNILFASAQVFTADGTRLGQLTTNYYNNSTITIPSDYEQDPVYGMLTIQGSTAGQDLVITSVSLTPQDDSLSQVLYPISTSAIVSTLVERNGKGEVKVATPTEDDSAANKAYVDEVTSGKLDAKTVPTKYPQVYAKTSSGTQYTVSFTSDIENYALVERTSTGTIKSATTDFTEPSSLVGTSITTMAMCNKTQANRLALLPSKNIIVEYSTDGGETWTAETNDYAKQVVFAGAEDAAWNFPKTDNKVTLDSRVRVTFTCMNYNVPEGTAESDKYTYWNKDHVVSTERYFQLTNMWFFLTAARNKIQIQIEGATGASPDTWTTFGSMAAASGWSGSNQVGISPSRLVGGATTQTTNYWNMRLTFRPVGTNGETDGTNFTESTNTMNVINIQAFGYNSYIMGNNFMAALNSPFKPTSNLDFTMQPGNYYPQVGNTYKLGREANQWASVFAQNFFENNVSLENKYLAKDTSTGNLRAYVIGTDGANATRPISTNGKGKGFITIYNNNLCIDINGTPTADTDSTNKLYVDTVVNNKIDKFTEEDGKVYLYAVNNGTQTKYRAGFGAYIPSGVPMYDTHGCLFTGTPAANSEGDTCANKKYVDNHSFKTQKLTQSEYDALETKDENTVYYIID